MTRDPKENGAVRDTLTHPLAYRLWRLRRLHIFALALPATALLGLAALTGGEAFLLQGQPMLVLAIFSTVALTGLMLKFPQATGEVIVSALTVSGLVLLSPLAEMLAAHNKGPLDPGDIVGLILIVLFAAAVVFLFAAVIVEGIRKMDGTPAAASPGRDTSHRSSARKGVFHPEARAKRVNLVEPQWSSR